MLTPRILAEALSCPLARAEKWAWPLDGAMERCEINTPLRLAVFLTHIGHESARLLYTREIWGPTKAQLGYERDVAAAWPPTPLDKRNRLAFQLGNDRPGDGKRFAGHSPMQCTGRKNHALARDRMRIRFGAEVPDFEADPQALEEVRWGALYCGWFWVEGAGLNLSPRARAHCGEGCNLNYLADRTDIFGTTLAINGGLNGLAERGALFAHIRKVVQA